MAGPGARALLTGPSLPARTWTLAQGGKDMGMPVVISALAEGGAMADTRQFFIGDEIVAVYGQSLENAHHAEAVDVLRHATLGVSRKNPHSHQSAVASPSPYRQTDVTVTVSW